LAGLPVNSGQAISEPRSVFAEKGNAVKLSLSMFPQSEQEIGGANSIRDARFDDA
jgi:hypothetical protein